MSTGVTQRTGFRGWAIMANGAQWMTVTNCSLYSLTTGRDSSPVRGRRVPPGAATGEALTALANSETDLEVGLKTDSEADLGTALAAWAAAGSEALVVAGSVVASGDFM